MIFSGRKGGIKRNGVLGDGLLWVLTTVLMVSFVVFEKEAAGKYIFLGIALAFFAVYSLQQKLHIRMAFDAFHTFTALFGLFCIASMGWAQDPDLTYRRMTTVVETILFMWLLYLYYQKEENVKRLLDVVCITGSAVAIYAIIRYGRELISAIILSGARAENSFANINAIGVMSAFSVVIFFSRLIRKQISLSMLLAVPCFIMVVVSGSRKAFAALVLGIVMLLLIRGMAKSRNPFHTLIRVLLVCVAIFFLGRALLTLPLFKPLMMPMTRLFNYFTGAGDTDESVRRRMKFVELGLQQFKSTPLFGMGIGNSSLLIGRDTYLHNNYIELLACGGLAGTLLYYAPYLYLIKYMIRYRRIKNEESAICLVLLLLILVMDFGQVSYFSKDTYFYLMLFFTQIRVLKRQAACEAYRRTLQANG